MLTDGLYEITNVRHVDDKIDAIVTCDPSHPVFKGHYPGQPVLPGACMLQITKDTLELALDKKLILKQATHMKFLLMVNPLENNQLTISLDITSTRDELKVSGILATNDKVCFKFKGSFLSC